VRLSPKESSGKRDECARILASWHAEVPKAVYAPISNEAQLGVTNLKLWPQLAISFYCRCENVIRLSGQCVNANVGTIY
jgi:hypothetical protein